MGTSEASGAAGSEGAPLSFATFLETVPPNTRKAVKDLLKRESPSNPGGSPKFTLNAPILQLHCPSDLCGGTRLFSAFKSLPYWFSSEKGVRDEYLYYACKNCGRTTKTFALSVLDPTSTDGEVQKFGERPAFGPNVPDRVMTLVGEADRELFLKGRSAESLGYGIGAYVYYRRVVENQKSKIILEIGKVAAKVGKPADEALFIAAAKEKQFSKALEMVKDSFPQGLLLKGGHNPLFLLHDALSESIHGHSDEECLEWAADMRLVLTDLAERISTALKDEATLETSVNRLLARRAQIQEAKAREK